MPITYMNIEWPNKKDDQVYSPSSIIKTFFKPQEQLTVKQFKETCTQSLEEASERVRQKFGYACTSAMAEAKRISALCETYDKEDSIKIISFK